ncbi:MAG: 30S ribosomal protein S6 [Bdellovibrionales bacterium]|nr:30S ribosomal protein S6 [Bdellovibrionales bacterium]
METQSSAIKRNYETIVILNPDLAEDSQKALFQKNKSILKDFGGEFFSLDSWGKRKLANPIGKFTRGVYFHGTFEAEPDAIKELERTMRISDDVLRFSHTRLDERTTLSKYMETFKSALEETNKREKEREEKFKARKAAMANRKERRN